MDTTVSARVPIEIKKQADKKLRSLGASTTDLINAAFRYLLAENELPGVRSGGKRGANERVLSEEQRSYLQEFIAATSFEVDDSDLSVSYKEEIAAGRFADYEALA